MKKYLLILSVPVLLAGCGTSSVKPNRVAERAPISGAHTANNRCVDDFAVLKEVNPAKFKTYQGQFNSINLNYEFYKNNAARMDKDQKELMTMELNSKLHLVCARVKNADYSEIQKKINLVSAL